MAAMRSGDFDAAHAISDAVLAGRDPAGRDDPNLPYHHALGLGWPGIRRPRRAGALLSRSRRHAAVRALPAGCSRDAPRRCMSKRRPRCSPLLATDAPGPDLLIPFRPALPPRPRECDIEIMELLARLARAARRDSPALGPPGSALPDRRARHRALLDGWRMGPFAVPCRSPGCSWPAPVRRCGA